MNASLIVLPVLAAIALAPSSAMADDASPPARSPIDLQLHSSEGYVPPRYVPYEGGVIPDTAHIEPRPNYNFIVTGTALLGTSYAGALLYALGTCSAQEACRQGSAFLYLPIVGPFITMATAPTTGGAALAGFDGGVQLLGAALAITGFVAPKRFVVWQDKTSRLAITPTGGGIAAMPAPTEDRTAMSAMGPIGAPTATGMALTLTHL